jgi:hypothetical protein
MNFSCGADARTVKTADEVPLFPSITLTSLIDTVTLCFVVDDIYCSHPVVYHGRIYRIAEIDFQRLDNSSIVSSSDWTTIV